MYPSQHVVLGFIFSIVLLLIFPKIGILGAGIIFFSSFLIDVDHYLAYAIRKNDWSLRNAYRWNITTTEKMRALPRKQRNLFYFQLHFLHGLEALLLLTILSYFYWHPFLLILTGFSLHLCIDVLHQRSFWDRADKVSVIYDYLKYKKLRSVDELK